MAKKKTPKPSQDADGGSEGADDLGLVSGADVKAEKFAWDWPGMIARGELNIIDGQKGCGKSSLMATIAATICYGKRLPESKSSGRKGPCLWFGDEESFGGAVVARWVAAGGKKGDIKSVVVTREGSAKRVVLPEDEDRLRQMVERTKARVIVIDPYTALAHPLMSTGLDLPVRLYLQTFSRIAHEFGVTILAARHLKKTRTGSAMEHGLGSNAISAVARSLLRLERDPVDKDTRYFACVVTNHGGAPGVIPYKMVLHEGSVATVKFGVRRETSLDELLEGTQVAGERGPRADARVLLTRLLADGPVDATKVMEEAKIAIISERTMNTVKDEMGIDSKRIPAKGEVKAKWQWILPNKS